MWFIVMMFVLMMLVNFFDKVVFGFVLVLMMCDLYLSLM